MSNFGDPIWENLFSTRDWGKYPSEEVIKFYKNFEEVIKVRKKYKIFNFGSNQSKRIGIND